MKSGKCYVVLKTLKTVNTKRCTDYICMKIVMSVRCKIVNVIFLELLTFVLQVSYPFKTVLVNYIIVR